MAHECFKSAVTQPRHGAGVSLGGHGRCFKLSVRVRRLAEAVQFSLDNETNYSAPGEDMAAFLLAGGMHGNPEPPGLRDIIGPTLNRGTTNGMILKGGKIVAEWGDTTRVDMTFSATKSYLATMVGLAWGDGQVSLDSKIGESVHDGGFDSEHNAKITWRHMLHQASEWSGTLFTKPDSVDHNRSVGGATAAEKGEERELKEPGSFYEYNDVRVNRLSLAALRVLRSATTPHPQPSCPAAGVAWG